MRPIQEHSEALDARARREPTAISRRNFVELCATLTAEDEQALVDHWRNYLIDNGVWANEPVPLYPYPSSPDYRRLWGEPDDDAWERAHEHYLAAFSRFSDIQEERPLPLSASTSMTKLSTAQT